VAGCSQVVLQQYLLGELSLILGELQAVATNEAVVRAAVRLRHEAETTPPGALAPVVERAVELTDRVCWDALNRGETAAFIREVAICAELWEFGVCAGLLQEDWTSDEIRRLCRDISCRWHNVPYGTSPVERNDSADRRL
jgi:hypothetical protein